MDSAPRGPSLDNELIARARTGDHDSFALLVERYQELAFRTAYVILRDRAEAEDVTQDAFINAFYALDRFRLDRPFRPWLLTIVANGARNRLKALARRNAATNRASTSPPAAGTDPVDDAVEVEEQRISLGKLLDSLRDEDRLVIACRYLLELTEEETANALGCPRGTVKSRLSRALGRLRKLAATTPEASDDVITPGGNR